LVTQNAHASTAFGSGSVVSGAYSGVWSGAIQNAGTGARADRNVETRSVIGGTGNYAIGNKNIVGSQTSDTFVLGNDVKIGASAATLTTANWAANPSRDLPRSDTVTFAGEKNITGAVALGSGTSVTVSDGVALGRASKASVDKGAVGADPLGSAADKTIAAWKSTRAAVSVGDAEGNITRQITSLAAGTQDTDAVNVAQLKSAGFKLQTSQSEGEVAGSNVENVQNGETVTVDAGKNIKLTQAENKITVATKDEVTFNKVTVGDTVVVEGRDSIGRIAVFLSFVIPILLFLSTLILGITLWNVGELWSIFYAFLALAIYYGILRLLEPYLRRLVQFEITKAE